MKIRSSLELVSTEYHSGLKLSIGAFVVLGIEYFISPKFSIGGDIGYGVSFTKSFNGIVYDKRINPDGSIIDIELPDPLPVELKLNHITGSMSLYYYFRK
ncbi:hypothetical protein FACS1894178_8520 [Bacteroidia bacterium]|nr:hypothetical protein FACS1894178_8520 [Bacteroidia bacterium]